MNMDPQPSLGRWAILLVLGAVILGIWLASLTYQLVTGA
jgi:hypothetical protein